MAKMRMGYEAKLYYGNAGSTAATQITNAMDITVDSPKEYGDTTVRGDGTSVPIKSSRPTSRAVTVTFTMGNKDSDAALAALLAAEAAGTPVAIRVIDKAAGAGPDADFYLAKRAGKPLNGAQTIEFTCTATDENRAISTYV